MLLFFCMNELQKMESMEPRLLREFIAQAQAVEDEKLMILVKL